MNTWHSISVAIICILCVLSPNATAVTINEVLANEPGGSTSLEWIEIYNSSDMPQSLSGMAIIVDGIRIALPDSLLPPDDYQIICRRLISGITTPGFETIWGDSTGFWGDSPAEQALLTPIELPITLINSSGVVHLVDSNDDTLSMFQWVTSGRDGTSWERISSDADSISQSADYSGSTPGFLNSLTFLPRDLAIDSVKVSAASGRSVVSVDLISRSSALLQYSALFLYHLDGDTIAFRALEEFVPGERHTVELTYDATGEYLDLVVSLTADDRTRNNRIEFVGSGDGFPGFILNEMLPNPSDGQTSEWVELLNRSGLPLDLNGWSLGDPDRQVVLSESQLLVEPGEYVVAAEDTTEFLRFNNRPLTLIQPLNWVMLKNSIDTVILTGLFEIEADRVLYDSVFDRNVTISRDENSIWPGGWGYSQLQGGTPGEPNLTVREESNRVASIDVTPNPFSPDGDGFEDQIVISLDPLPNADYTLKIYDRQGRVVRNFVQEGIAIQREVIWDGRSDVGKRLPIGIYILYFEQDGLGSEKVSLVVAR